MKAIHLAIGRPAKPTHPFHTATDIDDIPAARRLAPQRTLLTDRPRATVEAVLGASVPVNDRAVIFWSVGLFLSLTLLFVHLFDRV